MYILFSYILKQKFKLLFVIVLCLSRIPLCYAQVPADVTLNTNQTTGGTIIASHSITLGNGFSFNGTNGNLLLKIVAPPIPVVAAFNTTPSDENYIWTKTPLAPVTDASLLNSKTTDQVMQAIQYFDGLGRPMQTVQIKGNGDGTKDVIQPVGYDDYGREAVKYLPYADGNGATGSYRSDALQGAQTGFYITPPTGIKQNNSPYAQTLFELSPENRVTEQGAPGDAWQLSNGHTQKMSYGVNAANSVEYYVATGVTTAGLEYQRTLTDQGFYNAGELYLTITKNENWISTDGKAGTIEEYKDKEGRLILKRFYKTNTQALSTYYIYDYKGNLTYVLPPGTSPDAGNITATALQNFGYQYYYDGRNRMIEKRIPGKDWEYIVYNPSDQIVLTQDGSQHGSGKWLFTKYDQLGRTIMTGIYTSKSTRVAEQSAVNSQYNTGELTDNTTVTGYTALTYPSTNISTLTINYYDNYSFPNASSVANQNPIVNNGVSLLTGSKVYTLDGASAYLSANYYDEEGRITESVKQNHLGGIDRTVNTYSFTGAVLTSALTHVANSQTTTVLKSYVYDHLNRKRQTKEQINGGATVLLSQVDFNDVGQAITKHLHSEDNGTSFLQDINYTYNERGWLRTSTTSGNLLNLDLRYDTPEVGVTPAFNGSITQMYYNTTKVNNPGARKFTYSYDPLNRLTSATSNTGDMDEAIGYNDMGNITSIARTGSGSVNLSYNYEDGNGNSTNQLFSVNNNGSAYRSYAYDLNGNATSDGDASATNGINNRKGIIYNILNLPQAVQKNGTTIASYLYDATGQKLKNTGSAETWDYDGEIVYKNNSIAFIQTEEGRAQLNGSAYNYTYDLKDHLGNVRVSFRKLNNTADVIQEDEYYAFGLKKQEYDNSNGNRYLYNGKELQQDLTNQYDYGARFYDAVIGRWSSVDPLAEKSRRWSPYNYASNNPINKIDPDGMADRYTNDPQNTFSYTTTDQGEMAEILGAASEGRYVTVGGGPTGKDKGQPISKLPKATEVANQDGPKAWWQSIKDYWANVGTVAKMTIGWGLGLGADTKVFINDRVANSLRDSPGVNYLRTQYYENGLTHYNYPFEIVKPSLIESAYFQGAWDAGVDPVKQFIGSYSVDVTPNLEGGFLQFTIINSTTLRSAGYHITPARWNISPGHPMGTFNQVFIFTEPIKK